VGEKAAVEPTWRQPDARKGKEAKGKAGENETEPFGGKTQTTPENHTAKVHERRERVRDDFDSENGCGKAGENETEPFGGKTQTKPETHTAKVHERWERVRDDSILKTGVGNDVERTGRKEGGNKA
jgi:hypothetical protein